jgi:hypothetical protein
VSLSIDAGDAIGPNRPLGDTLWPDSPGVDYVASGRDSREDTVPREIDRDEVQRLVAEGDQLVEVLPPSEYREDHLPGAINLPLRRLEERAESVLDRDRPIIVYGWDSA